MLEEHPEGLPAMGDPVLLRHVHAGEGAGRTLGDEDGVVSESPRPVGIGRYSPAAVAPKKRRPGLLGVQPYDGREDGASMRRAPQVTEEREDGLVSEGPMNVGGIYPRESAKSIDEEP